MPRSIPAAAATEVAKARGTEPLIILDITWGVGGPTSQYADKDYLNIPGKIKQMGNIDAILKLAGSGGSSASVTITLDDSDETIKDILNTVDVQKGSIKVYQAYEGLAITDRFLLFTGEVVAPIERSESDCTVTFEALTKIEDKEYGFSPEEGQFEFISPNAVGKAWPLCYGSPLHVPAVQITDRVRGRSLTRFGLITQTELDSLCDAAGNLADAENAKNTADTTFNPLTSEDNYEVVIENLTSATLAVNTQKEALVADAPNKETDLTSYVTACKSLRENQNNKIFYTSELTRLDELIDERETLIDSIQDQIASQQALLNAEYAKPSPDPAVIASLTASISALNDQLDDAIYGDDDPPPSVFFFPATGGSPTETTQDSDNPALSELNSDHADALLQLQVANSNIATLTVTISNLESTLTRVDLTTIIVEDGDKFPQGTEVTIIINNMKFRGTFSGEVFTVDAANIPFHTGVKIGARQNTNVNEFWVDDSGVRLKNLYCWMGDGLVFVTDQDGTRCFFTPIVYEKDDLIKTGALSLQTYSQRFVTKIIATAVIPRREWLDALEASTDPDFANGRSDIQDQDYNIEIGDEVFLDEDFQTIWIANLIPSTSVKEVLARRNIEGVEVLVPVPSRYYTVNLSESIAGQTATTIRLKRPLDQYFDENWINQIFVSLVSSVGPNTADEIEHLVTNWSSLTVDAASFATVKAAITKYPSHFALLERGNTLQAIEQIAWQARCAAYVREGVVFLKYLSTEGTPVLTIDEPKVEETSFVLSHSQTEDLVTKLVAEWDRVYSAEERNKVVLRNNVGKYGEFEETFNFFIYNIESLVIKSATFWLMRLSNIWKVLKLETFLQTLALEEFDSVELNFSDDLLSSAAVTGVVELAEYDSGSRKITYEIWSPVRAGFLTQYAFAYPADAAVDLEYPTEDDEYAGGATS